MIRIKELITLGAGLAACVSAEPRDGMSFEHINTNNDGTISPEEFVARTLSGDTFKQLDANGDYHASQQELKAMRKRQQVSSSPPCPEHQVDLYQIQVATLRDQEYSL